MPVQSPSRFDVTASTMGQKPVSPPKTIFDAIPLSLVLTLAKPYLAGQGPDPAIKLAHDIYARDSFCSTLDILGEDAKTDADCDAFVTQYHQLVDSVKANLVATRERREQMTISMKPSMFSTSVPQPGPESQAALEKAFDRLTKVVEYGFKNGINMTLEAEDHRWANFHLESYFALVEAGYTNLGTVVQTRLFRTEKDIARFDERMRVRLVIGIYNEPAQVAHTDKNVMKDLVVRYAARLLQAGTYVELATHDSKCIESFYKEVAIPNKVPTTQFEHQFLLGVPRAKLQQGLTSGSYFETLKSQMPDFYADYLNSMQRSGALVRMYLPFGTAKVSGAYCRRRLRENPNMITYGIKNVLGIQ